MKKTYLAIVGLLLLFFVGGCSENTVSEEPADMKVFVHDFSVGNVDDVASASITGTELILTDSENNETIYDLPEDEFFVSIAPFLETTHPCTNHSLTSCQGEMVETEFDVFIEDEEGNVVMDESMTSFENGFIDLWLPRDKTYTVKIEHDGKIAESEISTFDDSQTCITTMQLI